MADVEKRSSAAPATLEWEYAPAPESREIVSFEERYGLFVGGEQDRMPRRRAAEYLAVLHREVLRGAIRAA